MRQAGDENSCLRRISQGWGVQKFSTVVSWDVGWKFVFACGSWAHREHFSARSISLFPLMLMTMHFSCLLDLKPQKTWLMCWLSRLIDFYTSKGFLYLTCYGVSRSSWGLSCCSTWACFVNSWSCKLSWTNCLSCWLVSSSKGFLLLLPRRFQYSGCRNWDEPKSTVIVSLISSLIYQPRFHCKPFSHEHLTWFICFAIVTNNLPKVTCVQAFGFH